MVKDLRIRMWLMRAEREGRNNSNENIKTYIAVLAAELCHELTSISSQRSQSSSFPEQRDT